MKRIKDVVSWISLSIAALFLMLIMHVVTAHADYQFLFKFGSWGTGDGQFLFPEDIAVDSSGNIIVSDSARFDIQVFDSSGNFLFKFGSGISSTPQAVAVNSSGNIYVSDSWYDSPSDAYHHWAGRDDPDSGYGDPPPGFHRIQVFGEIVPTPTPMVSPSPTPSPTPEATATPSPEPSPTEPPTAVELVSFKAKASDDGSVTLRWRTATEVNNAGFNLYRAKLKNGSYTKINGANIPAEGSSTAGASYEYKDTPGLGIFYYKLEDVDTKGVRDMHGPVKIRLRRSAEGEAWRKKK